MTTEFPLHDATFDGIITRGKNCALYFTASDGRRCEVELIKVDALIMDGFCEGNIIVYFGVTRAQKVPASARIERLYPDPHPSTSDQVKSSQAVYRQKKADAIAAGELTLIEMQPTIGADLLAVCEMAVLKNCA